MAWFENWCNSLIIRLNLGWHVLRGCAKKVKMILYNIKSAWRSIRAARYYSLLHIIGLGVAIATAVFIFIWVKYERSFDQFNPHVSQIYRVNNAYTTSDGNNTIWISSPAPLRKIALQNKQVAACVRIGPDYGASRVVYQGKTIYDIGSTTRFVDTDFFSLFALPLLKGDPTTVLASSNQVVLSASMARKLFGRVDPIGKVITLHDKDHFVVSGIAKDMPSNSSLPHMDIFLPLTFIAGPYQRSTDKSTNNAQAVHTIDDEYGSFDYGVYVRILPGSNIKQIENQITKKYLALGGPDVSGNLFVLQSLKTMHLVDEYGGKSMLHLVDAFGWIGLLIILIACINYVNLSTARALVRLKEVGIKKILGADRKVLMGQFLMETALILFIAILAAAVLVTLFMPLYCRLTGHVFSWNLLGASFMTKVVLVLLGAYLASGVYPALLLSNFRPLAFMRGQQSKGRPAKFISRRVLVVIQFAISVVIVFGAAIMIRQMHYIKTKDVGYNRSLVFTMQMPAAMENHSDAVIAALQQNSAIAAVSTANQNINEVTRSSGGFGIPGRSDIDLLFNDLEIAPGFLSAMQMKLTQGAGFSGTPADSSGFLLNQTAVRVLNLQHPIGQQVIYQGRKGTVIGVVRDFNFQNLKEKIAPIVIYSRPGANGKHGSVLYVRAKKAALQPAISSTEAIFKQYAGELPFKYDFLDKNFNSAYDSFSRSLSLLNIFSLVAVLISGMGLFGLATYTAEVKTKEIGIRKVMGASKKDIIELISRDFVLLVLLATLIALPVGSWMMHRWLTNFAYKITIGPWVFVIVILFMMLITWLIIGFKALQAASKNPVKSLKTE